MRSLKQEGDLFDFMLWSGSTKEHGRGKRLDSRARIGLCSLLIRRYEYGVYLILSLFLRVALAIWLISQHVMGIFSAWVYDACWDLSGCCSNANFSLCPFLFLQRWLGEIYSLLETSSMDPAVLLKRPD